MSTAWFVSSDNHLLEPPDLFTKRIEKKYRDRAPKVKCLTADGVATADAANDNPGIDYWVYDDTMIPVPVVAQARPGDRFSDPRPARLRFTDVPSNCYTPDGYLSDMQLDGVYSAAFNPSSMFSMYSMPDGDFMQACFRAYNDYALEFASHAPDRLRPICIVNLDDIPSAIGEMERVLAAGAGGVHIPVEQVEGDEYDHPRYEPFWAAAEANEAPLHFHIAGSRRSLDEGLVKLLRGGARRFIGSGDRHVRYALMNMIYSGVFERHPRLTVVSVENGGGWVPFFLQEMDWHWRYNSQLQGVPHFHDGSKPSDHFRRNVYVSIGFMEDGLILKHPDVVDFGRVMWASDYPHDEGSFPKSRDMVREMFGGVPSGDATRILQTNASNLYGLDVPAES